MQWKVRWDGKSAGPFVRSRGSAGAQANAGSNDVSGCGTSSLSGAMMPDLTAVRFMEGKHGLQSALVQAS